MVDVSESFLRRAIKLAEKCKPEDERVHPKVGCVIIKDGKILAEAYRNQFDDGDHAESTVLRTCSEPDLRGATLITTLEPCTTRRHPNLSCTDLIIHYGIGKVVYGIVDPNPDISGKSEIRLRSAGIKVETFPVKFEPELKGLIADFFRFVILRLRVDKLKEISNVTNFLAKFKQELPKHRSIPREFVEYDYDSVIKVRKEIEMMP
jgi:pyrimidine deaminase RibD-like protein